MQQTLLSAASKSCKFARKGRTPRRICRLDLTKDERDRHIRRYAELLEIRAKEVLLQNEPKPISSPEGGRPKTSIAQQIAEETGLSKSTVQRALNPKPPVQIKSVIEPESEQEAIIREANAIVAAWNRARQAIRLAQRLAWHRSRAEIGLNLRPTLDSLEDCTSADAHLGSNGTGTLFARVR
ncbi:hypothetical protein [Sphingosinicella sp.]|uniref:hypothetical protein n=1 Tax=Sphingosinicella sp. TaxID=1917971 RepID=UPI0025E72385|nr:hypothetical protein [Sphingosinicella sp.]